MESNTLMWGMIAINKMRVNMFMPIVYLNTVKPLSGSVGGCYVATLDMLNDKLQYFLCGNLKKIVTWNHWDVGEFLFLPKYIYGREDINERYENVENIFGIAGMSSTVQKWFSLRDHVSKHNVKVCMALVKDMKRSNAKTHFTMELSEQW